MIEAVVGSDSRDSAQSLPPTVVDAVRSLTNRRAAGEPLQYLTGIAGFRRLELQVGPGVLIPRPETESVAGRAIDLVPQGGIAVDVGTGSGAIALAIADERPDAVIFATDCSDAALAWAEKNRGATRAAVELIRCDLMDGLPPHLRGTVDVVVSNPPYVATSDRASLPVDVVEHEPHEALFADGDGMSVLRRLAPEAMRWLRSEGWIVLEIGESQEEAVLTLLGEAGYADARVSPDLAGRPRIAEGRKP